MINKIFKTVILILMVIGIVLGVSITVKRFMPEKTRKQREENIFNMIQAKSVETTDFYVYGRAFNINGKIGNISKDNFEGVKLIVTDGFRDKTRR